LVDGIAPQRTAAGAAKDRFFFENRMPTKSQIHRKVQILSALVEARQNILAKVSALSEAQRDYIFLGIWSIKDLLAHLAGWDYTNLEAVKEILAAKLPTFYARYDHDWKTYNAMLVAKYKPDSFEELIALIKRSQRELIDLLETLPPEAFNRFIEPTLALGAHDCRVSSE
jgi:hypothetical protein